MKRYPITALVASFLALGSVGCAEVVPVPPGEPVLNVSPGRHGNLAAAQQLVENAYDRLGDAQQANKPQLGGHAARAKELLREANVEIKLAAIAVNQR